ncbi:hypothetical protein [Nocardia sp. NPDC003726]
MTETVTKEKLDDAVERFRHQLDEWKKMPDKINDTVDNLKWYQPAVWAFVTPKRDAAQEWLQKLLEKMEEAHEGIQAPFTFIEYAAEWQSVASTIRGAGNEEGRPELSLDGHWTGVAKDRFAASKSSQEKAMTTADDMAKKVHDNLLTLATSGWELYKTIADELTGFLASLVTALEQTGSVALAYQGAPNLVAVTNAAFVLVEKTLTATVGQVRTQMIIANEFKDIATNPWGFPGDRWPDSVSATFNEPKDWKVAE